MRAQQQLNKSLPKQEPLLRQLCSQIDWKTKLELIRISNVAGTSTS